MAVEHVTYDLTHVFSTSGYKVSAGIPSLVPAGVSMEIIWTLYEWTNEPLDCTGCTITLTARPLNSLIGETTLATGTVSGANNNIITTVIPKDTIPDGWARYEKVRFLWTIENAAGFEKAKIYQDNIVIISFLDTEDIDYPYSEDISISSYTYSVDTTLDDKPGLRIILIDGCTVTLPDISSSTNNQVIIAIAVGASGNILAFNGATVNGEAGPVTLPQHDGFLLMQDGSTGWYALNPDMTIP